MEENFEDRQGTILEGGFILQTLLRRENHADIYAIGGPQTKGLLARVYDLRNCKDKVRKYRLRNLKRNLRPDVQEFQGPGYTVLLCPCSDSDSAATARTTTVGAETSKLRKKSSFQRESARISQLEKRRAQRRDKSHASDQPTLGEASTRSLSDEADSNTFSTMFILWVGLAGDQKWLARLSSSMRESLEGFLQGDTVKIKFDDITQMVTFLSSKRRDSKFLNQHLKNLPDMIESRKEQLSKLQDTAKNPASHAQQSYKSTKDDIQIAEHQLMVLEAARNDFLPKFIKSNKRTCRLLETRIQKVRKLKAELDDRQNVEWSMMQVPGSAAFGVPVQSHDKERRSSEPLEFLRRKYVSLLEF